MKIRTLEHFSAVFPVAYMCFSGSKALLLSE